MTTPKTVKVVCKFTGLEFEAASKRSQVHPTVATWKQEASKRGWYGRFFEAIDYGVSKEFKTIEQFREVFRKAQNNEQIQALEEIAKPKLVRDLIAELTGEEGRAKGSFLKKILAIDPSRNGGYSLLGNFVNLDSPDLALENGVYLDFAAGERNNTDIRKQRKAYGLYTLFILSNEEVKILFQFSGRRLNECLEKLSKIWELSRNAGIQIANTCIAKDGSLLGKVGDIVIHENKKFKIIYIDSEFYSEDEDGISSAGYRLMGDAGAVIVREWTRNWHYLQEVMQNKENDRAQELLTVSQ